MILCATSFIHLRKEYRTTVKQANLQIGIKHEMQSLGKTGKT